MKYGAPHSFQVRPVKDPESLEVLTEIHFQEGPIKECGVNGVMNEDLIAMVITRLEHFQKTQFACREKRSSYNQIGRGVVVVEKTNHGTGETKRRRNSHQIIIF